MEYMVVTNLKRKNIYSNTVKTHLRDNIMRKGYRFRCTLWLRDNNGKWHGEVYDDIVSIASKKIEIKTDLINDNGEGELIITNINEPLLFTANNTPDGTKLKITVTNNDNNQTYTIFKSFANDVIRLELGALDICKNIQDIVLNVKVTAEFYEEGIDYRFERNVVFKCPKQFKNNIKNIISETKGINFFYDKGLLYNYGQFVLNKKNNGKQLFPTLDDNRFGKMKILNTDSVSEIEEKKNINKEGGKQYAEYWKNSLNFLGRK